jgi:hypothetical protein
MVFNKRGMEVFGASAANTKENQKEKEKENTNSKSCLIARPAGVAQW